MSNYTRKLVFPLFFQVFFGCLSAQSTAVFTEAVLALPKSAQTVVQPEEASSWIFDRAQFEVFSETVPHENQTSPGQSEAYLDIPQPDGGTETFKLVEYDLFEPELAATFPNIRVYRGVAEKNPHKKIRLDLTDFGLRAVIRSPEGMAYIDPARFEDPTYHLVYRKEALESSAHNHACSVDAVVTEEELEALAMEGAGAVLKAGDCALRTYRFAMATTGEYSNYFGATNSAQEAMVMSAVATAMNRVNEVFENELSIRFILANNTNQLFYYDGASDPYTNSSPVSMLAENQINVDNVIGNSNYDIGHVVATSGGGVATLEGPCNAAKKARGVTGLPNPVGDVFYVDFLCHEIGHQFGARHTFNNACGGNRSDNTAFEPGSGSTIMAYAGSCSPNVQSGSDPYFHAISLAEIGNYVSIGEGNNCSVIINTSNNQPQAYAGNNYVIPRATPFKLTASATDPDGDAMTYCWEQMNNEISTQAPLSTATEGPNFRSRAPQSSPDRYFPQLSDLANNLSSTWEVLSSVSRDMDFRLTVRDNAGSAGGCTAEDDMTLSVVSSAGPFTVDNISGSTSEGQEKTVTWNVAGTNTSPINCTDVDILLSKDGGLTYPDILAEGVDNDGSAEVIIPTGTSNGGRIMVRAEGNVFFNVNNSNFTINSGTPDYYVSVINTDEDVCQGAEIEYQVEVGSVGGFNEAVFLSVGGAPSGSSVIFSQNPVTPGSVVTLTISNTQNVSTGSYSFNVIGSTSGGSKQRPVTLNVNSMPNAPITTAPTNNEFGVPLQATFEWQAVSGSVYYNLEIDTEPSFSTPEFVYESVSTSFTLPVELEGAQQYFWRVRSHASCGGGNWSTILRFETIFCKTYTEVGNESISQGSPSADTWSFLNVQDLGEVVSLEVENVKGTHDWVEDLSGYLVSPSGTSISLWNNLCGSSDDFNLGFSMSAGNPVSGASCSPLGGGSTYIPTGDLDSFAGENVDGNWGLRLNDNYPQDGGVFEEWSVKICIGNFVNADAAPLPVELISFTAEPMGDYILLNWETDLELENRGFEVERKEKGADNFSPMGFVEGAGTASFYKFEDKTAARGITYQYRLRQIDLQGAVSYSEVREAVLEEEGTMVRIFPNPTSDYVQVETSETGTLAIYNASGEQVFVDNVRNNSDVFSIKHLPSGVYALTVESDKNFIQHRLVIND